MDTYTLADLETWSFEGTALAVVGHPIEHSLSPKMHNAALRAMGESDPRLRDWRYFRFDIPPHRLEEATARFHEKKFKGLNLTIPHKVEVLELIEEIDSTAKKTGAANTLVWQESGYRGTNTDGFGLGQALKCDLDSDLEDAEVVLLGAGGAGRAAAVQCLEKGCRILYVGNRSQDRLEDLLRDLESQYDASRIVGFDLGSPPNSLPLNGLLINSTSLGLRPGDPSPISLEVAGESLKVFDMVYSREKTPLVGAALEVGLRAVNGLSMLVWQGVRSLEIWSEAQVPASIMTAAARRALADQR